jgi:hypothetical protein
VHYCAITVNYYAITVLSLCYEVLSLCYHCAILPCDFSKCKHRRSITVPNITDCTALRTASGATKHAQLHVAQTSRTNDWLCLLASLASCECLSVVSGWVIHHVLHCLWSCARSPCSHGTTQCAGIRTAVVSWESFVTCNDYNFSRLHTQTHTHTHTRTHTPPTHFLAVSASTNHVALKMAAVRSTETAEQLNTVLYNKMTNYVPRKTGDCKKAFLIVEMSWIVPVR